ncbi:MAG: cytochrome c-type biogenesis protein CcmH [Deltaproteobacteria bacterium]|nr:cytochrome c-type biogenesis protein CcmH [Deltaproteobacteria bacterium]
MPLFLSLALVEASDLTIGRMRVAIWPEYDDPGVLVIYDGRFKDDLAFPAETSFLIPKGAVISDACSLSPKGQHFCQLYKVIDYADVSEVRLKLPFPNFYLSFHIEPFEARKEEKQFRYIIKVNHPIDRLEVNIQRPLRSEGFKVTPEAIEKAEAKGFELYNYAFDNVPKGKVLGFKVEYVKKDTLSSVDIKYSPMAGPKVWGSPYETQKKVSTILYSVAGMGALLLIGLLWFLLRGRGRASLIWLLATGYWLLSSTPALALTVQEVARELACPCECPLVLEDCNMSCGLDWKDQIGQMIAQGKTKEEIIKYFVDKYGEEARITPIQRIRGKFYQYTRGFDTKEWVILWTAVGVWLVALFLGVYLLTSRIMRRRGTEETPR